MLRESANSFFLDFLNPTLQYRLQHLSIKKEALLRAIAVKSKATLTLIDATAGLCTDGLVMAAYGHQVTALERHERVFSLLSDAVRRAEEEEMMKPILDRLTLIHQDAGTYLAALTEQVDVVYLDPMFPERKKSAKVKKPMQIMQALVGEKEEDHTALFALAKEKALHKLVVKRPKLAPFLTGEAPSFQVEGKTCRFDVYHFATGKE